MIKKFVIKKSACVTVAVVFGLSLSLWPKPTPAAGAPAAAATHRTLPPPPLRRRPRLLAPKSAPSTSNRRSSPLTKDGAISTCSRKKFEPKQNELKGSADEIDSLKKQLNAQQDKLNEESRDKLVKQIETKQKSFDRSTQDAQEDFQNQQGEIGNKILTKMAPLIVKYASDNGYGMILDTSQQWPRGPVIWYGPAVDITQPIVEAYNVQSGVAAPAAGSTAPKPVRPATARNQLRPRPSHRPALRRNSSGHRSDSSGSNSSQDVYLKTACRRGLFSWSPFLVTRSLRIKSQGAGVCTE